MINDFGPARGLISTLNNGPHGRVPASLSTPSFYTSATNGSPCLDEAIPTALLESMLQAVHELAAAFFLEEEQQDWN